VSRTGNRYTDHILNATTKLAKIWKKNVKSLQMHCIFGKTTSTCTGILPFTCDSSATYISLILYNTIHCYSTPAFLLSTNWHNDLYQTVAEIQTDRRWWSLPELEVGRWRYLYHPYNLYHNNKAVS